jgi:DNA-binding transcriptional regulator YhcF (GntR family)
MGGKARFGIVYADVIQDPGLSMNAKAVYALLATFANKKRECFPSITHLSELLSVNRRTVERSISELKSKGYIQKSGKLFTIN